MRLNPDDPRPPYLQVEAALADAIDSGRFGPGDKLPSYSSLAAELGVAKGTVQAAVKSLTARGFVVPRQGSGVFVRSARNIQDVWRAVDDALESGEALDPMMIPPGMDKIAERILAEAQEGQILRSLVRAYAESAARQPPAPQIDTSWLDFPMIEYADGAETQDARPSE